MNKKPRYAVMLEGNKTIYRGNSRFVAWTLWLINRHRKAIAYIYHPKKYRRMLLLPHK